MISTEVQQVIAESREIGMTQAETKDRIEEMNLPVPSDKTLGRHYNRDGTESPASPAQRDKAFDHEPFRSCIIEILRNNRNPCASSIYDVLIERYVETGDYEQLPASDRSLRRYVQWLKDNGVVDKTPKNGRIYDHVFDTPPGDEMLIDFGDYNLGEKVHLYFICLLLRYSRYLVVFAQDHKYNSAEACRAIYNSFLKIGGRPGRLVIDQDAVFISSELYGEVIRTDTFDGFCREQQLDLFVCRKADPESKGPIENSVAFVKKSYLSARSNKSLEELIDGFPDWLLRVNRRIHRATFCVPETVFREIEKPALRDLLPSLYSNSPRSFIPIRLRNYPYVQYRSNKYYFPSEYAFHQVMYRVVDGKIYLYDGKGTLVTTYDVSPLKGQNCTKEGFAKKPMQWLKTVEEMRRHWDCPDFQHFVNGIKKDAKGRYLNERFNNVYQQLLAEDPDPRDVACLMKYCCEHLRYAPSQISDSWELLKKSPSLADSEAAAAAPHAESRDLAIYQKIFDHLASEGGSHNE